MEALEVRTVQIVSNTATMSPPRQPQSNPRPQDKVLIASRPSNKSRSRPPVDHNVTSTTTTTTTTTDGYPHHNTLVDNDRKETLPSPPPSDYDDLSDASYEDEDEDDDENQTQSTTPPLVKRNGHDITLSAKSSVTSATMANGASSSSSATTATLDYHYYPNGNLADHQTDMQLPTMHTKQSSEMIKENNTLSEIPPNHIIQPNHDVRLKKQKDIPDKNNQIQPSPPLIAEKVSKEEMAEKSPKTKSSPVFTEDTSQLKPFPQRSSGDNTENERSKMVGPRVDNVARASSVSSSQAVPRMSQDSALTTDHIPFAKPKGQSLELFRASSRPRNSSQASLGSQLSLQRNYSYDAKRSLGSGKGTIARRDSLNVPRRTTIPLDAETTKSANNENSNEDLKQMREEILIKRESRRKRRELLEDDQVLVGTKVSEGHANYVIAYNMLTGIRVSVSRCCAKNDRPLTEADFTAKHKLAFDVSGNELTPSARYDFKFKDYAPWVFRHLRQLFHLDNADYLMSLTSKYIVSELGSPGKSGSFFYFSRDYRFIIKTIHHSEHRLLLRILKDYYNHVKTYPNTLISQFYGLHRVKLPYGRKIHFIVMNNLFPPHRDIHLTFDLKGSLLGRELKIKADEAAHTRCVYKDVNWIKSQMHISLGPKKHKMLLAQMECDVALLQKLNIMDYSLLLGIHDGRRGNSENIRKSTLSMFEPDAKNKRQSVDSNGTGRENNSSQLRKILSQASPTSIDIYDEDFEYTERKYFTFYREEGGFRATDDHDEPLDEIYYLGIIDCLTPYTVFKRVETMVKSFNHKREEVSAIPAVEYGNRFLNFVKQSIRAQPSQLTLAADAENNQNQNQNRLQSVPLPPAQPTSNPKPLLKVDPSNKINTADEELHARSPGALHGPHLPVVEECPSATLLTPSIEALNSSKVQQEKKNES